MPRKVHSYDAKVATEELLEERLKVVVDPTTDHQRLYLRQLRRVGDVILRTRGLDPVDGRQSGHREL